MKQYKEIHSDQVHVIVIFHLRHKEQCFHQTELCKVWTCSCNGLFACCNLHNFFFFFCYNNHLHFIDLYLHRGKQICSDMNTQPGLLGGLWRLKIADDHSTEHPPVKKHTHMPRSATRPVKHMTSASKLRWHEAHQPRQNFHSCADYWHVIKAAMFIKHRYGPSQCVSIS